MMNRRSFLKTSLAAACVGPTMAAEEAAEPELKVSLAQWSVHKMIKAGELTNLGFPAFSKETFGIDAVEYVSGLFDKAPKADYVKELKQRAEDAEVSSLLIMVDGEGKLGMETAEARSETVSNHEKWLVAAKELGCHSIRVNAGGEGGTREEQAERCVAGLTELSELALTYDLNVLVENHGGLSSHGKWLSGVLNAVNLPNCGSLPDFGNFIISRKPLRQYDRYEGMKDLMPLAKAVSAKSYAFDENGDETLIDYAKMATIVKEHSYTGYVGIEYEGADLSEVDGVRATHALLKKVWSL